MFKILLMFLITTLLTLCNHIPFYNIPQSCRTSILTAISSLTGITSTSNLYSRPVLSADTWVYLSIPSLSANISTQIIYKVYMQSQNTTYYTVSVAKTNTLAKIYRLDVNCFQYKHNQFYFNTNNCMFDIKYFDSNINITTTSSVRRNVRLYSNMSAFMSTGHHIKCISHITGVNVRGEFDVVLQSGIIDMVGQVVYLDISIGPLTLVTTITVYVLLIDQYLALFNVMYRYESSSISIINSIVNVSSINNGYSNSMYGNNINSSEFITLYGMSSFNYTINNIINFDYMLSVDNTSNILSIVNNYMYLSIQNCPSISLHSSTTSIYQSHINLPYSKCQQYYEQIFQQCTLSIFATNNNNGNVSQLKHIINNQGIIQQPIKYIQIQSNKQIILTISNNTINLYQIQSNNQYKYIQQIIHNSTIITAHLITTIKLTYLSQMKYKLLMIADSYNIIVYRLYYNSLQVYDLVLYYSYLSMYIILDAIITQNGDKIIGYYRKNNNKQYVLTFMHQYLYSRYKLMEDYNTGRVSASSSKIHLIVKNVNINNNNMNTINNNIVDRLWIFNSYGFIQMQDSNNTGKFHSNIINNIILKSVDDNVLINADITDNLQLMIATISNNILPTNPSVSSSQQYHTLNIYNRNSITNSYTLFQTISQIYYTASLQQKLIKITNTGLLIFVQIGRLESKYQLIYSRNTIYDYFTISDSIVIYQDYISNLSILQNEQTGMDISDNGDILVIPYNVSNIVVLYCTDIYINNNINVQDSNNMIPQIQLSQIHITILILSYATIGIIVCLYLLCIFCLIGCINQRKDRSKQNSNKDKHTKYDVSKQKMKYNITSLQQTQQNLQQRQQDNRIRKQSMSMISQQSKIVTEQLNVIQQKYLKRQQIIAQQDNIQQDMGQRIKNKKRRNSQNIRIGQKFKQDSKNNTHKNNSNNKNIHTQNNSQNQDISQYQTIMQIPDY